MNDQISNKPSLNKDIKVIRKIDAFDYTYHQRNGNKIINEDEILITRDKLIYQASQIESILESNLKIPVKIITENNRSVLVHILKTNELRSRFFSASLNFPHVFNGVEAFEIKTNEDLAFPETISMIVTIEQLANLFSKGNTPHIIISSFQTISNKGIDLVYSVIDAPSDLPLETSLDDLLSNIDDAEFSLSGTEVKFTTRGNTCMADKGLHMKDATRIPSGLGPAELSTFKESYGVMIKIYKKYPKLAPSEFWAEKKRILFENVYAKLYLLGHSGGIERNNWIKEEKEIIIPYRDVGGIIIISGEKAKVARIRSTEDILNDFKEHMRVKIGQKSITFHSLVKDGKRWIKPKQMRYSGSPYYDFIRYYAKRIYGLYKKLDPNDKEILDRLKSKEMIDSMKSGSTNYLSIDDVYIYNDYIWINQITGLPEKRIECKADRSDAYFQFIPDSRKGQFMIEIPLYSENESGTKLVIGQIKQITVQMIHYAILAGITKALCDENEISTDILNKLITRRSTVYINEKPQDAALSDNLILQFDRILLGETEINSFIGDAHGARVKWGDGQMGVYGRGSSKRHVNDLNLQETISLEPITAYNKLVINRIDIYTLRNAIYNVLSRSERLVSNRIQRLHTLPSCGGITNQQVAEDIASTIKKTNSSKISSPDYIYRVLFFSGQIEYIVSLNLKIQRLYESSLKSRGLEDQINHNAQPFNSIEIIDRMKDLLNIIKDNEKLIRYGRDLITAEYNISILPRPSEFVVGIKTKGKKVKILSGGKDVFGLILTDETFTLINKKEVYNQLIENGWEFIEITSKHIEFLWDQLDGRTIYEKIMNLYNTQEFKCGVEILHGFNFLRTTPAGRQYINFKQVISEFKGQDLTIEENFTQFCLAIGWNGKREGWSSHYADFYIDTIVDYAVNPKLTIEGRNLIEILDEWKVSENLPENILSIDYNHLINLFDEMSYGQYMEFMRLTQISSYYHIIRNPQSELGSILMEGLLAKICKHWTLVILGLAPASGYEFGKLVTALLDYPLYREGQGSLLPGSISDESFAGSGYKVVLDYFGISHRTQYNSIKHLIDSQNPIIAYLMSEKINDSFPGFTYYNQYISERIDEISWIFELIEDLPQSQWVKVTKRKFCEYGVTTDRGAYNLFAATPNFCLHEGLWNFMLSEENGFYIWNTRNGKTHRWTNRPTERMELLRERKIDHVKTSEEKIKKISSNILNNYKELIKDKRTTLEEINEKIVKKLKSYNYLNKTEKILLYAVLRDELKRKKKGEEEADK